MKHILSAVAAATLFAAPLHAASTGFTDFIGFGDSLSDKGRFPTQLIAPPSDDGRFSDGPTWMERVGDAFEARGGKDFNMSLGGATLGPANTNLGNYAEAETFVTTILGGRKPGDPDDIPFAQLATFADQVSTFVNGPFLQALGDSPLVTILLGGNDVRQVNPAVYLNPVTTQAFMASLMSDLRQGIEDLYTADNRLNSFMVTNLPSFNLVPALFGQATQEAALAQFIVAEFNSALAAEIAEINLLLPVNVELFDLFSTFSAVHAQGVGLGKIFDDTCVPSYTQANPFLNNQCLIDGQSDAFLFGDDIHPNTFIHEGIAASALQQLSGRIAPIPLPAGGLLLIAGFGALTFAARKKAA